MNKYSPGLRYQKSLIIQSWFIQENTLQSARRWKCGENTCLHSSFYKLSVMSQGNRKPKRALQDTKTVSTLILLPPPSIFYLKSTKNLSYKQENYVQGMCIGSEWPGFGSRGGFSEKLTEASYISDRANSSHLQEDLLLTKTMFISDGGSKPGIKYFRKWEKICSTTFAAGEGKLLPWETNAWAGFWKNLWTWG